MLEDYKAGTITRRGEHIADVYIIPASLKMADKLNITRDMNTPPVWQVRDTGKELEIYYEAEADTYKFPVYKKATGRLYEEAMKDIEKTTGRKIDRAA